MKKITPVLFAFFILLFTNCEKEEVVTNEINKLNTKLNYITIDEFQKDKIALEKFNSIKNKKNQTKNQTFDVINQYNFNIDTNKILLIEKENLKTYTFSIINDSINSITKNLVITERNNIASVFVVSYNLSENDKIKIKDGEFIDLKNKTSFSKIDEYETFTIPCFIFVTTPVEWNEQGQVTHSLVQIVEVPCPDGPSSGGSGGGGGDDGSNGGYGGGFSGGLGSGGNTGGEGGGFGNGSTGGGNPDGGNTGGYSYYNPNYNTNGNDILVTTPLLPSADKIEEINFYNSLTSEQQSLMNFEAVRSSILNLLSSNSYSSQSKNLAVNFLDFINFNFTSNNSIELIEILCIQIQIGSTTIQSAKDFMTEIRNIATSTDFSSETDRIEITKVLIFAQINNYFNQNLDTNFFNGVDSFTQINFQDPQIILKTIKLFAAHCAILKQENPTWSNYQVFKQAYLDATHLILDLNGLVPLVGEFADITNGIIYTIEGDGVNASLSFASAVPIAGWFAAGVKLAKRADGLKFIVVGASNLIEFGAANSRKFRAACGLIVGDITKQAHHLLPRATAILQHAIVQKAAKATINEGFHIDQALNGIAVATWRNQPNHFAYNNRILAKLNDLPANLTPNQAYAEIMSIINQAKQAVINNPNTHLNDLIF